MTIFTVEVAMVCRSGGATKTCLDIQSESIAPEPQWVNLAKNRYCACAVERRWTTAGESPARELGSLHPEAIGAAVEETKPSEPLV
jgi:hypothetical protein